MNAIPTKYAGVQFRSRLEARWAAFFDLGGFDWEYEPFDLAGYIPDFLLGGKIMLEVKPLTWDSDDLTVLSLARAKMEGAGGDARYMAIVGAVLPRTNFGALQQIGTSAVFVPESKRWEWGEFFAGAFIDPDGRRIFGLEIPMAGAIAGRATPDHDVAMMWREAGNRVQWKAGR